MPAGVERIVPLPLPCFSTVTVSSLTSGTTRSIGAPAVRFTFGTVPPKILAFAELKAETVIVRFGPTGA